MSITRNEWAGLFFAKESKSFILCGVVDESGGVMFSDEGDPAEAQVLSHVGTLATGDRVLCVVATSGAVYVLGKVNDGS